MSVDETTGSGVNRRFSRRQSQKLREAAIVGDPHAACSAARRAREKAAVAGSPEPLAFRVRHKCGSPNICETDAATCASEAGGFEDSPLSAPLLEFGSEIWVGEGPIIPFYFGFSYPTRMVVVRLSDGDLFVWSPIPLSLPMRREVDKLGPVRHLVAPNLLHHLFLAEWKSAYPEARLYAAPGLRRRRGDLTFDFDLVDAPNPRWAADLDQVLMRGSVAMTEVVFFHYRSRTVIFADLIQNLPNGWFKGWRRTLRAHRRHRRPEPRRASGLASRLHRSSRGACVVGTYSPLADRTSADRSRRAGRHQWVGVRSRGLLVASGTTRRPLGDQEGGEVTPQRSLESPHEPLGRAGSSGPRPIRPSRHSGILSCFFQGFSSFLFRSMASARESRRRVACGRITSSI